MWPYHESQSKRKKKKYQQTLSHSNTHFHSQNKVTILLIDFNPDGAGLQPTFLVNAQLWNWQGSQENRPLIDSSHPVRGAF